MLTALLLATLASFATPQLPVPERAREPWVFRSVLDGRPRIVTLALCRDLWAAYDTQTGGIYKCWKGGVSFQGAVYTSVHGAQPVSTGRDYQVGLEGAVWSAEIDGKPAALRVQWHGYFIKEGRVHLEFDLRLPDGRVVRMQETPECVPAERVYPEDQLLQRGLVHGMPVYVRSFMADAVPDGVVILLKLRTEIAGVRARDVFPPHLNLRDQVIKEPQPDGSVREHVISYLPFTSEEHANHLNLGITYDFLPDPEPPAQDQDAPKKDGQPKSDDKPKSDGKPKSDDKPKSDGKKGG